MSELVNSKQEDWLTPRGSYLRGAQGEKAGRQEKLFITRGIKGFISGTFL